MALKLHQEEQNYQKNINYYNEYTHTTVIMKTVKK